MHVVVAQLWRVEAREMAVVVLSGTSLLGLEKQQRVDGERGAAVMMGCLMEFAFSPGGLEDGLEVPRRDEEDAEARARGGWS